MEKEDIFVNLAKILKEQERQEEDIKEIYKAYKFAEKLHEGQYRVSEEPYIIHPVEVAKILATLKVDKHTLMAAILHDTIEDTGVTAEQLTAEFGEDVTNLVLGLIKDLKVVISNDRSSSKGITFICAFFLSHNICHGTILE